MASQEKENLIERKMDELCDQFELLVDKANQRGRPDSPARYFHIKTINRLRAIGLESVFDDSLFFDYLYATLATWGMDTRGAILPGFQSFLSGVCENRERIIGLSNQSLATLSEQENTDAIITVIRNIWEILPNMKVSQKKSQLVAGSKTLHHLLPDLVPPIDRRYTLDFFFGRKTIRNPQADFSEVFVNYLYIYERTSELVDRMIAKNPLNSSVTKVIDNAIIGYQAESRTLT